MDIDNYPNVQICVSELLNYKKRYKNRLQILLSTYAYYLDSGYYDAGSDLYDQLYLELSDSSQEFLLNEVDELKKIYLDHDRDYLSVLEKKLEIATSTEEVILYFRMAKLCEFIGDNKKAYVFANTALNKASSKRIQLQLEHFIDKISIGEM